MWMVICSTVIVAASKAPAPRVIEFPGAVHTAMAPDRTGGRIFYRPHVGPDGSQASPVFFDDGRGRVQRLATLLRNMEIGWSPNGKRAFLQNNWAAILPTAPY